MKPAKTTKKPKRKIGTIKAELAACRAAFRKYPSAQYAWCVHHDKLIERIRSVMGSPIQSRIRHILLKKSSREKAIRFRNLRPVKLTRMARSKWTPKWRETIFNRQWPGNTWNGRNIFDWNF